jgi:hypothetical protein
MSESELTIKHVRLSSTGTSEDRVVPAKSLEDMERLYPVTSVLLRRLSKFEQRYIGDRIDNVSVNQANPTLLGIDHR